MEVYLDSSATTRPYVEVVEEIANIMNNTYANPSSLHSMGKKAEDTLNDARSVIAKSLSTTPPEIIFTSGGTESDNLAIIGAAMAHRKDGNRLVTQKTEHMAVLQAFEYLEAQGFEVVYVDVDKNGVADADEVMRHVDDKTILVSIMHVNNETGAIMPIEKIGNAIDHSRCLFHVDAVQSYGKIPINPAKMGIDLMSISSHKIHGPNGVGALYVRKGVRLLPQMHGGKQESGLRSGTENLAGICGFAKACQIKTESMQKDYENMLSMKKYLSDEITGSMREATVNSCEGSIPYILNISFTGLKSEVLLHVLESKGIYVSTGSACNSKKNLSYVLKSMGINDKAIDGAIRISFSTFNTMEEMKYVAETIIKEASKLIKIMR